jgi:hypothetical protein
VPRLPLALHPPLALVATLAALVAACPQGREDEDETPGDDDSAPTSDDDCAPGDDDASSGGDDDSGSPDDDDSTPAGGARVSGIIRDSEGLPLAGVSVGPAGEEPVTTGADGRFLLPGLPEEGELLLSFSLAGYAPALAALPLHEDASLAWTQVLAPVSDSASFAALGGGSMDFGATLGQVSIPGGGLVTPDGTGASGVVTASGGAIGFGGSGADDGAASWLSLPDPTRAVDAFGAPVLIRVYGAAIFVAAGQDGAPLDLAPSASASVEIALYDPDATLAALSPISAFHLDPATATWVESAQGSVQVDGEGAREAVFQAGSLGYWLVGVALQVSEISCISGSVANGSGTPRAHATVRAIHDATRWQSLVQADASGAFCAPSPAAAEGGVVLEPHWSFGADFGWMLAAPLSVPAGAASCETSPASCVAAGQLRVDHRTCVSGVAVDSASQPIEGMDLRTSVGVSGSSGINGAYCLTVPVLQSVTLYGPLAAGDGAYLPWTVFTEPAAWDCSGGCPNIAVMRPYLNPGCVTGTLRVDGVPSAGDLLLYDLDAPALPVHALTAAGDGSFCADAPASGAMLATSADPALDCIDVASADPITGGRACSGSGCDELPALDCASTAR